ncbi:hypothetical protein D3C78_1329890 [compost metagenome]
MIDECAVLAIERVGQEHHVQAQQLRVITQCRFRLRGQCLAQVVGTLGLEHRHQVGNAVAIQVGILEIALDAHGLQLGIGVQAQAGILVEHLRVSAVDQRGTAAGLKQRGPH